MHVCGHRRRPDPNDRAETMPSLPSSGVLGAWACPPAGYMPAPLRSLADRTYTWLAGGSATVTGRFTEVMLAVTASGAARWRYELTAADSAVGDLRERAASARLPRIVVAGVFWPRAAPLADVVAERSRIT